MKPQLLESTIRIAHCTVVMLLLAETSSNTLRADEVQRFQSFLSHPPNILSLRYETSNPPLSNHIEYWLAWSRDAFRREEFGRKLTVIDGEQTAEHVVAGASGQYRDQYWEHSAGSGAGFAAGSRLTIYEQPSPSLEEVLQDNDGKSLQEIEAYGALHLGIRFASPDTIIFKGKTFSTLPYIGLEGAIKTIGADGRVKELEYEYHGLRAVVSYAYDNPVFPDHSYLPSWFRTVMTTPEEEHFLTSENRIHEWGDHRRGLAASDDEPGTGLLQRCDNPHLWQTRGAGAGEGKANSHKGFQHTRRPATEGALDFRDAFSDDLVYRDIYFPLFAGKRNKNVLIHFP